MILKLNKSTNLKFDQHSSVVDMLGLVKNFRKALNTNKFVFWWPDSHCNHFETKSFNYECQKEIENMLNYCKREKFTIKIFASVNGNLVLEVFEFPETWWDSVTV